jgi:hypothetical protein
MQVIGKMKQLLGSHGDVDTEKVTGAITVLTELSVLNIAEVNKASEGGGLYVARDGEILETYDSYAEGRAAFKIVPTGLRTKFNNTPLVASFVKSKGTWVGALIDIPERIFKNYKKAYGHGGFNEQYVEIFCGENHGRDITGFGLNHLLHPDDITEEIDGDTPELIDQISNLKNALDKAEKCLLDKSMNKSKRKKAEEKVANLKKQIASLKNKAQITKDVVESEDHDIDTAVSEEQHVEEVIEVTISTEVSTIDEPVVENDEHLEEIKHETDAEDTNDTEDAEVNINNIEESSDNQTDVTDKVEEISENTEATTEPEQATEPETEPETEPAQEEVPEDTRQAIDRLKAIRQSTRARTKASDKANTEVEEKPADVEIAEQPESTEDKPSETAVAEQEPVKPNKPTRTIDKATENEMWAEIGEDVSDRELELKSEFVTELYNKLMDKENWAKDNGKWLLEYIKGLVICIDNYRKLRKKDNNGYVLSDGGKKMLFNTGLIDTYGNFIYIIDHTASTRTPFEKRVLTIVKSKSSLLDEGFTLDKIKVMPKRFKFVSDNRDLVFNSTMDEFDIIDTEHLNHIINERRSRFPEKYANESCKNLADKIKISIEQAIEMQEVNYKYIVPMYNLATQEIEFLIPMHLDTTYDQKPELCIIVAKKNGLWKIFTIISSDLAYSNARLISKVCTTWLD